MVQRYEFCQWSNDEAGMQEEIDGEYIKYEDYERLKKHAHAMAMAMLDYDCGERVSFQPYKDYLEWCKND